jgi:hypothetical protein
LTFDNKGQPPSVTDRIAAHGGILQALHHIIPGLAEAGYISRVSTSSGITIEVTGEHSDGGSHHFVPLTDGSLSKRFLDDAFDRAWLDGMGWIQIGAGGQLLKRSIVDTCTWDPARLVFEADATLGPGLSQAPRPAVIHEGNPLVCPATQRL